MTQHLKIGLLAADLTHKHGWAHYSTSVIQALQHAGVECVVLTTTDSPPLEGVEAYPILPSVEPIPRAFLPRLMLTVPTAERALRTCKVLHTLAEPFAPLATAIAGKRPAFISVHGSYIRINRAYPRWTRPIYTWAYRRATLLCASRYTIEVARAELPIMTTRLVNHAVNPERFTAVAQARFDTPQPIPRIILSVGAVKRRKGILELVQAFAQIRSQFPEARLHIVGSLDMERAYVETIRAEIARHDMGMAVTLAGRIPNEDLMRAYADADIFALPSLNDGWKFEGYGLAILEGSAAGLPVISTRDCGAADVVQHGVTGFLASQERTVDDVAAALKTLLSDPALVRRMGEAGRAFALEQRWEVIADKLITLYRDALTQSYRET